MPEWKTNLVSVVMPAHNSESLLQESVRSVMAQTYADWELLIVDDASTDRTLTMARELALSDGRIRVIEMERNGGVAAARNTGIRAATGQYLAFLDSDDLWLPEKLQTQVQFMQQSGAAFSFTQYRRFGRDGSLSKPVRVPSRVNHRQLLRGNVIGCLTVLIDRSRISEVEMPSTKHEDYVTWLGLLRSGGEALGLPQDLARYRVSSTSVSGNKTRSAAWTWNIYRRTEGFHPLKSAWYFMNYVLHAIRVRWLS